VGAQVRRPTQLEDFQPRTNPRRENQDSICELATLEKSRKKRAESQKAVGKKIPASDRRLISEPGPCRTPVSSLGLGGFHAAYRKSAVPKYGPVVEHGEQVRLEIGKRSVFGPVHPIQDGMEPVFVSRSELSRKPECRVGPARLQTPRTWSGSVEEAYPPEGIDW